MATRDLPDWRSYEQALALDLSLVESVFRRLIRQRFESNQTQGDENAGSLPTELDQLLFAKSDVLVALETAGRYLDKRPLLRSLHTGIACISNEKEVRDLSSFTRRRLREHTISCAMVKRRLTNIYETTREKELFEQKVLHFKQQAKASSPWCVRNWKCIAKSPSQFYAVHKIPPKPKTARQLELERQTIAEVSREVVVAAISAGISKIIPSVAKSSKASGRRPRSRQDGDLQASRDNPLSRTRYDDVLRSRARSRRNQAEREERVRQLRLELFAPELSSARTANPEFAQLSSVASDGNNEDGMAGSHDVCKLFEELLAFAEANGDVRIARQLLDHPISRSGIRRAVEQAKNLDVSADNLWEVVKIWRSVYRTRIVQALHNAMCSLGSKRLARKRLTEQGDATDQARPNNPPQTRSLTLRC